MSESQHSNDDANPYDASTSSVESPASADASPTAGVRFDTTSVGHRFNGPWMLPAILIVILMWIAIVVPGKLFPMTMAHFLSMQLGPVVGALLVAIWWLASRRVSWKQKWIGLGMIVATWAFVLLVSHDSMVIALLVYGLPLSLTILVAFLALLPRSIAWPRRGWLGYAVFATMTVGTLLFRIGEIDAEFAFNLVPRWTPTSEDRFLAELDETSSGTVDPVDALTVPEQADPGDWPAFRGPNRDGRLVGVSFDTDWDQHPPNELWRRPVGPGWSSFCAVAPLVFTQEQRGDDEAVVAYRAADGAPVWSHTISARFEASMGGVGPRATPTFDRGRLYVTGAAGQIQCLDAVSGEPVWAYDLIDKLDVRLPDWGFASSPLLVDDLVVVVAGGGPGRGVVALDQADGTLRWAGGDASHSYCSAQLETIGNTPQLLIASNRGLQSLDPASGEVIWAHESDIGPMARVTQPLTVGSTIYLGTGYGYGTERVDVQRGADGWSVSSPWTARLKPYFNDFVHHQGYLYGFDNKIFVCIDAQTGDRKWKGGRYGYGQVLLVDELGILLVSGEQGELVLLEANPEQHREIATINAVDGITWNHPVIAHGRLYVRNAEQAVCFQLPGYELTVEAAP